MDLSELVGNKMLSGIDRGTEKSMDIWSEDANFILVVLDGIAYKFKEDPSDGYRSYMEEVEITNDKVINTFAPQPVICQMKPETDDYSRHNILEIFDSNNSKLVLELGTDNTDDYYPYCVMNWNPENLSINV